MPWVSPVSNIITSRRRQVAKEGRNLSRDFKRVLTFVNGCDNREAREEGIEYEFLTRDCE